MNPITDSSDLKQPGEEILTGDANSVGLVETQYVRLFTAENKMPLESGASLGPVDVAYETYGQLNEKKDNAILITHALSGDAHVAGRHKPDDRKPGWWDLMIGPGKPFDTNKYFIVCSNNLGGCMGTTGPSSINPETGKPYGLHFPIITISDMVDLQKHLIDHLGIKRLLAVAGGSMGGMATLDWAIRYPDRIAGAIPVATTARLSAQSIAFNAVGRNAILHDKYFQQGDYYQTGNFPNDGLAVARMVGHITYLSQEAMHAKFGRRLQHRENYQYDMVQEFSVESYLDYQGSRFVDRFDANTYVYFSKAMDYFDLDRQYHGLTNAMQKVQSRFLVISFSSDWLFPPRQSHEIVDALIAAEKNVTYCNIECPYGHDSFLLETKIQGGLISGFLSQLHHRERGGKAMALPPVKQDPAEPPIKPQTKLRFNTPGSIFAGYRVDYREIARLIAPDSSVLDLGSGDGELLALLEQEKNIYGMGVTLGELDIVTSVKRGVSVVQYDLSRCLSKFRTQRFEYVVLSQALQVIRQPEMVLRELMRIGRKVIVSFPNFAYWRGRLQIMFRGRAPVWKALPYSWYNKPEESVNYMSISDFEDFLRDTLHARLIKRIAFNSRSGYVIRFMPNFIADEVIFVFAGADDTPTVNV